MGNASSLSGGRILKCLPTPAHARQHAPWPAQLAKRNARSCGGSCTGWLEENWALCSQRIVRRASLVVRDTLATVRSQLPTHALLTPWGTHPLYLGAEF